MMFLAALIALQAQVPTGLLPQAKAKMAQNLKVQPNYVCMETIERSKRVKAPELVDVLRFEVAFAGGKELYSWPGSGRFGQNELWEMVPMQGSIGTGSFAVHAKNLLVAEGPVFGAGEVTATGLVQYPFDVALEVSSYRIHDPSKKQWVTVGYHGLVFVERGSGQVTKLDIVADKIPPALKLTEIHTVLEYGTVAIGGRQYRLPIRASDIWTREKGGEQRNNSYFSSCRAYTAESKLSFEDPTIPSEVPAGLPDGVEFQLEMLTPIDSRVAKAGDALEAALVGPLGPLEARTVFKGEVLRVLPMGLTVEVEIRLLNLTAAPAAGSPPITKNMANRPIFTRGPGREGIAEITVLGERLVVPKGYRSTWVTLARP